MAPNYYASKLPQAQAPATAWQWAPTVAAPHPTYHTAAPAVPGSWHPAAPATAIVHAHADFASPPLSPASPRSNNPFATSAAPATYGNALVLYSPTSLHGLYYNEHVHGPFATGLQANPFTPGLAPTSGAPLPRYATSDPVAAKYPASRSADDPLNWITEDLFRVSEERSKATEQRAPLRQLRVAGAVASV